MTRTERKANARLRVGNIVDKICEIVRDQMGRGESVPSAISAADKWCVAQVEKCPQDKHFYTEAGVEFKRLLRDAKEEIDQGKVK